MLEDLTRTLDQSGRTTEVLRTTDGTRLLLLPYGARVLGLFSAASDHSFYWHNPALRDARAARALFADSGWHNTGGDRTWIAPELDTFYPDPESTQYRQPRPLDMSDYEVAWTGGGVQLSRNLTLHLARPDRDVPLRLEKWLGPAANPLRCERDLTAVLAAVEYAGYTQRVTLEALDDAHTAPPDLGIWNLLQLPPGGDMLVPLYSPTTPQRCFGDVPADRITAEERLLRIRVDFPGSHKLAVKAASLCGRTGYAWQQEGGWSLVLRNFCVNPSGSYVDVQRHDPRDRGYAFQLCRVDEAQFGSFCEMEYHAPGLGAAPAARRSDDTSQIWAFRGARAEIAAIAHKLLGVTL